MCGVDVACNGAIIEGAGDTLEGRPTTCGGKGDDPLKKVLNLFFSLLL